MSRTYSELILLPTFEERIRYLQLNGNVGEQTFGGQRALNQVFYKSTEWKELKQLIIIRDNGCDMGLSEFPIFGKIFVHHIEPLTKRDIIDRTENLLNPENLICVSFNTHQIIHYRTEQRTTIKERSPGDTKLW